MWLEIAAGYDGAWLIWRFVTGQFETTPLDTALLLIPSPSVQTTAIPSVIDRSGCRLSMARPVDRFPLINPGQADRLSERETLVGTRFDRRRGSRICSKASSFVSRRPSPHADAMSTSRPSRPSIRASNSWCARRSSFSYRKPAMNRTCSGDAVAGTASRRFLLDWRLGCGRERA